MSITADAFAATPVLPRWAIWVAFPLYAGLLGLAWWALADRVPDQLVIHLMGHAKTLTHVHDKLLGNATLVLAILPFVLWLECALVGWRDSSARALLQPSDTVRTDLAGFVLDQIHLKGVIAKVMMLGATIVSGEALQAWIFARTGFAIDASALPLPLRVLVYFYVYSFFDYWAHRIGHTRLFWPLHRYHHAAQDMCVLNGARQHPAGFVSLFLINVPLPLLGADAQAMIWVNVATVVLGFLIHSRLDSDWGWVGRHLLQSPRHHRLHHKLDMTTPTGFFGMTPIWDRLFGGWSAHNESQVVIGVDTDYRHGFWIIPDLLRDYRDFWLGLIGKRRYSPSER